MGNVDAGDVRLEQQLKTFQENGYLQISGLLSQERVDRLNKVIDDIISEEPESANYDLRNTVARHSEIADLMDDPLVLPLVVNIMGYNIQLSLSHLTIRQPHPPGAAAQPRKNAMFWHQDGPVPGYPAVGGITPLFYLKICYILSDLTEPCRGNTKIVPGSWNIPYTPQYKDDNKDELIDEMQLCGKPGDAFLFPQNLWHAAAPNLSGFTRRQLFIGYSYLWMRPLDYHTAPAHLLEGASPVRKQLLGQLDAQPFEYYVTSLLKADLPLKSYYMPK